MSIRALGHAERRQTGKAGRLVDFVTSALRLVLPVRRRTGRRRPLDTLGDHMLKDIGLGRADIERDCSPHGFGQTLPPWRL